MLVAADVHAFYGESHILHGVNLQVAEGEIVCLLGRNGVGKTTFLRTVMGLTPRRRGSIQLDGREISGLPSHRIAKLGVGFVPEGRGIFPGLTVYENLRLGLIGRRESNGQLDQIYEIFPILKERTRQTAGLLSGGEQQVLAIARALVAHPRFLVVDEFSEGLQPSILKRIGEIFSQVSEQGVAILFVEQNARFALSLARRGYIMEKGQIVYEGDAAQLLANEQVLHRHLVI